MRGHNIRNTANNLYTCAFLPEIIVHSQTITRNMYPSSTKVIITTNPLVIIDIKIKFIVLSLFLSIFYCHNLDHNTMKKKSFPITKTSAATHYISQILCSFLFDAIHIVQRHFRPN